MRRNLLTLIAVLSTPLILGSCAIANIESEEYIEPVQQVDNFNYDYDYPLEMSRDWYLQEAQGDCGDDWSIGKYVEYEGSCYKLVSRREDADLVYTENKIIWARGKFGGDRGQDERVEDREGDYEQGREDRDVDQER